MRIVSLIPSLTETLFDFGLTFTDVIGRTKFCIHPRDQVKKVQIIGGTKNLNLQKIRTLNPDLIIANKEENEKAQIEELNQDFRVWLTEISNLADNHIFLEDLGKLLGKADTAQESVKKINGVFPQILPQIPAAYLIWQNPYMTIGNDTFIHDVMRRIGLVNIFGNQTRYPEIEADDLQGAEVILLSTEPFPFKEKHVLELQHAFPSKKILLVDGEAFSWYGTHLAKCAAYFGKLQHIIHG